MKKAASAQVLRRRIPKMGAQSSQIDTSFSLLQMAPTASLANFAGLIPLSMSRSVFPNFSPGFPAKAFLGRLVLTYPGMTLQTLIPKGRSSERMLSRMPMKACLEPPQEERQAVESLPAKLVMPTICPLLCLIMWGTRACRWLQGPCTLMSQRETWFSKEQLTNSLRMDSPAFSTTTSMRFPLLYRSLMRFSVIVRTCLKSAMSITSTSAFSGCSQPSLTLSSSFWFLAERMTYAPWRLNSQAMCSPIPEEAPVTHTVLLRQLGFTVFLRMQATTAYRTSKATMETRIITKYQYYSPNNSRIYVGIT